MDSEKGVSDGAAATTAATAGDTAAQSGRAAEVASASQQGETSTQRPVGVEMTGENIMESLVKMFLAKPPMKTPVLNTDENALEYKNWKKKLGIWRPQCNLPKDKMGLRVAGEAFKDGSKVARIVASINNDILDSEQGLDIIIETLDRHFLPSMLYQGYEAINRFYRYNRQSNEGWLMQLRNG